MGQGRRTLKENPNWVSTLCWTKCVSVYETPFWQKDVGRRGFIHKDSVLHLRNLPFHGYMRVSLLISPHYINEWWTGSE